EGEKGQTAGEDEGERGVGGGPGQFRQGFAPLEARAGLVGKFQAQEDDQGQAAEQQGGQVGGDQRMRHPLAEQTAHQRPQAEAGDQQDAGERAQPGLVAGGHQPGQAQGRTGGQQAGGDANHEASNAQADQVPGEQGQKGPRQHQDQSQPQHGAKAETVRQPAQEQQAA